MEADDVGVLLERAAPAPSTALDVGAIERRAGLRGRRRWMSRSAACAVAIVALVGLAVRIPDSRVRTTLATGPEASRKLPVKFGAATASIRLTLLDGTQVRLTVPKQVGRELAGMTFADLHFEWSLLADDGPPHGWRIEMSTGSVDSLLPGADPVALPPSSRASRAAIDRPGRRLGMQFGSWTLVASGESLTDSDVDTLLRRVSLVDTPDGFVQYQGSLRLWIIDGPQAHVDDPRLYLSLFLGDDCGAGSEAVPPTAGGLVGGRVQQGGGLAGAELCDRADRLRLWLFTSPAPTDAEIHLVQVDVSSVGQTLAAIQRGQHP